MSSESSQECAICECFESAEKRTPCCYEWICDEHSQSFPMCSRKSCDNYFVEMCEIWSETANCFQISSSLLI